MNINRLRELLDVQRDEGPVTEAVWTEAGEWLEEHPEITPSDMFTEADHRIARQMQDVPIPEGLHARLIAMTGSQVDDAEACDAETPDAEPSVIPDPSRKSGRVWVRGVLGLATCLLVTIIFHISQPAAPASWTLSEVRADFASVSMKALPVDPTPAAERSSDLQHWKLSRLTFGDPRQFRLTRDNRPDVGTAWSFQVQLDSGLTQGRLLVVENATLKSAPDLTWFSSDKPTYIRTSHGDFVSAAWTDGEQTFICLVELKAGAGDPLRQLQQVLTGDIV